MHQDQGQGHIKTK